MIWRLRVKILLAAVNGFIAFLFGLGVQTAFMWFAGVGDSWAYVLQNVFSTQFSFLLARYVTWRHQRMRFLRSLLRYNFQQLSTTLLSIILFTGLDALGMWYVAANLLVTLLIAPLAFIVAHKWSIGDRRHAIAPDPWTGDGMAVATGRSAELALITPWDASQCKRLPGGKRDGTAAW